MCYKNIYPLLFVALLTSSLSTTAIAAPVPVDLDFSGPGPNTLNLTATADGTLTTGLRGKILRWFTGSPNPQTDPIGLNPNTITVNSAPARNALNGPNFDTDDPIPVAETASITFDSANLWTPLSISDVNLDLLNGTTFPFALDQLVLEAVSTPAGFFDPDSQIKIDLGGTFQSIRFYQDDGPVSFVGNTYSIPGKLVGVVDLTVKLDAFGGSLTLDTGFGTQAFDTPFTLEGTMSASNTSATDAKLSFDGVVFGSLLLTGISTTITFDEFGAQASLSLDVQGGINLNLVYHLEDTAHVPEPGTFVLLGIGAIGLLPVIRRRMCKS